MASTVILPMVKGMRTWNFLGRMNEGIPMKKSRFTEARIMGVRRQAEGGLAVPELCREHGISSATCLTKGGPSRAAWMRP